MRSSSKPVPSKTFVISAWNRCIQVRRTRLAFEVVFTMRKYRFNTGPIRPNLEYHIVLTQECSAPGENDKNRALNSRKPHKIVPNCCQMAPWRQLRHVLAPNLRKIQNPDSFWEKIMKFVDARSPRSSQEKPKWSENRSEFLTFS